MSPSITPPSAALAPTRRSFASLANRDFRFFFVGATAAMMADNVEHVISYFVMFQRFHSPALAAFAVVSHWVPYLLLAVYTGGLADRFDIRRLIQISMCAFMGVSIGWGVMFLTDSLSVWKAMLLLVIHGLAGVLWSPASQVLIHNIVGVADLSSAVRLTATGRYLAFLIGPALGAALMLAFGPTYGIFVNTAIYLPMFLWLMWAPDAQTVQRRAAEVRPGTARLAGIADISATLQVVRANRTLLAMTVLVGASAFFVGNAYQAQMPGFAFDLGHGRMDVAYSVLLAADAAGGLTAGLVLESRGYLPPSVRSAFMLAMIWCCALAGFALCHSYVLSITLLFIGGFVELGFNSMAQSLVQLNAPGQIRGRVIGVFSMAASGLRTFSGLCVGVLGAFIGIHRSLALSSGALFVVYVTIFWMRRWAPR